MPSANDRYTSTVGCAVPGAMRETYNVNALVLPSAASISQYRILSQATDQSPNCSASGTFAVKARGAGGPGGAAKTRGSGDGVAARASDCARIKPNMTALCHTRRMTAIAQPVRMPVPCLLGRDNLRPAVLQRCVDQGLELSPDGIGARGVNLRHEHAGYPFERVDKKRGRIGPAPIKLAHA